MRRVRLSRRAVLRGAGVAVALPTLDAMLDDRGLLHAQAWAQAAPPPVRLVTFFLPNGFPVENRFVPRETGAGYTITPCLDPIKAHVPGFTVLSNVQGRGGTCMHASGLTAFGTGLPHMKTGATGPSLDQVAARRNGMSTRFPSLVVGVQSAPIPGTNGNSTDIFLNVSWQDANQPSPADREPGPLFARLFGNGPQDDKAYALLRRNRRSVLDYLIGEVGRWKPRLGASDNARLDAHLSGLRELERRLPLETEAPAACSAPAMGNAAPMGYVAKAQLQCTLFATALACRLTSYGCFIYGIGAGDGGPDPAYGLAGNQHQETHANKQDVMQKFTSVQMQTVKLFLDKLKGTQEGTRTLLDNSLIMVGTELGNGTTHSPNDLPFVIAGGAGGRLKTNGTHIRFATAPKIGRLHLTLLKLAGFDEASFAGETAPIPELMG